MMVRPVCPGGDGLGTRRERPADPCPVSPLLAAPLRGVVHDAVLVDPAMNLGALLRGARALPLLTLLPGALIGFPLLCRPLLRSCLLGPLLRECFLLRDELLLRQKLLLREELFLEGELTFARRQAILGRLPFLRSHLFGQRLLLVPQGLLFLRHRSLSLLEVVLLHKRDLGRVLLPEQVLTNGLVRDGALFLRRGVHRGRAAIDPPALDMSFPRGPLMSRGRGRRQNQQKEKGAHRLLKVLPGHRAEQPAPRRTFGLAAQVLGARPLCALCGAIQAFSVSPPR